MDRYNSMPQELADFVRKQLTSGCYRSEEDVVFAALWLFMEQANGQPSSAEQHIAETLGTVPAAVHQSPRGLLADLKSDLSHGDILDARHQMWQSGFLPGEAG